MSSNREMAIGYVLTGSTGCSCSSCKEESRLVGIFDDPESAFELAADYENRKVLRSQYSNCGVYHIYKIEYEKIPDDRIIIGNRVFDKDFYEYGEEANMYFSYIEQVL